MNTVEINCPECGETLEYKFKSLADWGTGVAIFLNVGCPDDIGIPSGWRPKP